MLAVKQVLVAPGCILYATATDDRLDFYLGQNQTCAFVIYGEVLIALLAIGLLQAAITKAALGRW